MMMSGCSVKQMAVNALGDVLAEGGSAYAADDDVVLVGAAVPFGLKTIESLLRESPKHEGLLLAAAQGFTQYAYAYVELPADRVEENDVDTAYRERARARRLYLRARDYGMRGLEVAHPGIDASLRRNLSTEGVELSREDVSLLYWTGVSWAAAISLGKDDAALIAEIPMVGALMTRALELDEAYDAGALHTFFIVYEMSRAAAGADRIERAQHHFERSVTLSEGRLAAPYVAFAESVSVLEQNREAFEELLNQALSVDVMAKPEWILMNTIMQERARWLLESSDYYFSD